MHNQKKFQIDPKSVSFNAYLLLKELQSRKIKIEPIGDTAVFLLKKGARSELLYDTYSSTSPYCQCWIINDKQYSKKYLEEKGVPVSPGDFFIIGNIQKAINIASNIKYPVVLKPTSCSHGTDVYTEITSENELVEKIKFLLQKYSEFSNFVIEKHIPGREFRIFIAKDGYFAAVERIPANVVGDGKTSILMLIQRENIIRMNPRKNCLCEIRLDDITFDYMEKHNITLDYIPKKGERVFVLGNSNVSTGGNCYDVTDKSHISFRKMAKNILNLFPGVPYLGIDLICQDLSENMSNQNYIICELNTSPGFSLHMMPERGKCRDVAKVVANYIFPNHAE